MDYRQEALEKHAEWRGKLEVTSRVPVRTSEDLSLAYTPGVAEPCLAIREDPAKSFELTRRWEPCGGRHRRSAGARLPGTSGPRRGMPGYGGEMRTP